MKHQGAQQTKEDALGDDDAKRGAEQQTRAEGGQTREGGLGECNGQGEDADGEGGRAEEGGHEHNAGEPGHGEQEEEVEVL